jgi:hypothetical protein
MKFPETNQQKGFQSALQHHSFGGFRNWAYPQIIQPRCLSLVVGSGVPRWPTCSCVCQDPVEGRGYASTKMDHHGIPTWCSIKIWGVCFQHLPTSVNHLLFSIIPGNHETEQCFLVFVALPLLARKMQHAWVPIFHGHPRIVYQYQILSKIEFG